MLKSWMIVGLIGIGWWLTSDQQAMRVFEREEYAEAANKFEDPMWRGVAWYRSGDFKRAAAEFSRLDSAEAYFNQGNARLLLGEYDAAISCFDRALERRPQWKEAEDNRSLALARAEALRFEGGDMTGGKMGADEIVFDENASSSNEEVEVAGGEPLSDEEIQALWLRRLQTKPADFLKSKFSFQNARTRNLP